MNKIEARPVLQDRFLDHPYALGGRVIDPVMGTLSCQGQIERLRRKELEVLALLASADGAVVSRQGFIDVIWDGNNLVGDHAITVAISSLRQSLRDNQSSHPLIRTIPRRGYQLSESALQPPPGIEPVTESAPDVLAVLPTPEIKPDALRAPESAPLFQPGDTIPGCPGWRLTRRLSESASEASSISESWLAEASEFNSDEHTQARVFRFCRSEAYLRRLQREVTLLRYVNQSLAEHPGFAVIRDWQLDEPPYYLARDYAKFGSLIEWAGACATAPTPPLALMAQLSDALAALHALGVVHRNLNADRILVDETDAGPQFKISALGLGALSDRSKLAPLQITALGLTLGADEAQAHASTADDVAALGLVFLQLTLGDWQAQPTESALAQVTDGALQNLLRRCVGPTDLRPTAAALAQQLRAVLTPKSGEATPAPLAAQAVPQTVPAPLAASGPVAKLLTAPESIGPYRLLDQLGEGGMGTVYLAEQRDPYRKVALKIIRSGLDGKQILSRFDAERQALAMMNHPNVASVHDSGLAADGRPYFAMEYIAGEEITKYCDAHHLNLPARIKLFLQVCDGVLHAHQKGVLHRDIKPSNLMVSHAPENAGTVKVIDFGLAKSLHGKLATQTLHTSFGAFIGTPIYSSPEHVSGAASGVDTRSDIYSMGVVLYELLAGMTPIASASLENLEPEKVRELVCRSKLPSMREQLQNTSAEKRKELAEHRAIKVDELPKTLEGDLSWVVGKCLERDPNDRYASVLELKKDLERWLALRPVEARPTSSWYRFRKLVRRNKAMAALITASISALLLTTSAAVIGYQRAASALQRSEYANELAEKASDFQVAQIKSIDPESFGLGIRKGLLSAVAGATSQHGSSEQLTHFSELLDGIEFTTLVSEQLDEQFFQPSLEVIEKKYAEFPELQASLWQSNAEAMAELGLYDRALKPQQLAVEARIKLFGETAQPTLESKAELARRFMDLERLPEALSLLDDVISQMRQHTGMDYLAALDALAHRADIYHSQGKMDLTLRDFSEVRERARKLFGENDVYTLNTDVMYSSLVKAEEGDPILIAAQKKLEAVAGPGDPKTINALKDIAIRRESQGNYSEANDIFRRILNLQQKKYGDRHPKVFAAQVNLASNMAKMHNFSEAKPLFLNAIKGMQEVGQKRSIGLIVAQGNFGQELWYNGSISEAEKQLRAAIDSALILFGPSSPAEITYKIVLASVLRAKGQYSESKQLLEEALEWLEKRGSKNTTSVRLALGKVYLASGDSKRACEIFESAYSAMIGGELKRQNNLIAEFGRCTFNAGEQEKGIKLIDSAISAEKELKAGYIANLVEILIIRADAYNKQGQSQTALENTSEAIDKIASNFPAGHFLLVPVLLQQCKAQLGTLMKSDPVKCVRDDPRFIKVTSGIDGGYASALLDTQ